MKTQWRHGILGIIVLIVSLVGCSDRDPNPPEDESQTPPIQLVHRDLDQLASTDTTGGQLLDAISPRLYSRIFGGTSGSDVSGYFSTRIRYLLDANSTVSIYPSDFRYKKWTYDPASPGLGSSFRLPLPLPTWGRFDSSNVVMGAANIGTGLWLMGLINDEQVTLYLNGDGIPITSSRTGVMLIGPGYLESMVTAKGRRIVLPAAYRQTILMHEARHSDCTGGVTEAGLEVARRVSDQIQFTQEFPSRQCGHLHVYCPSGPYQGIAACDADPWGAYTVGAVYALAISLASVSDPLTHELSQATALDSISRVLVNGTPIVDPGEVPHGQEETKTLDLLDQLSHAWGSPDMSSSSEESAR